VTNFEILTPVLYAERFGLFSDFDGTLSPIVDQPEMAQITPENKQRLIDLKAKTAVIGIISGRAVANIVARVGIDGLTYIGNHGLERWKNGERVPAVAVKPYLNDIVRAAEDVRLRLLPGMELENKEVTLSIHYRQTAEPDNVREKFLPIAEKIANRHGLKLFEGRRVFELRPPIPLDKGSAFRALVREFNLDAAMFIGDDVTDTAAFESASELRRSGECQAFSVGVMDRETPQSVVELSDLSVAGVEGVASMLSWLNENLNASST
jgi:trehalose 6-phosphate phosphatase